MSESHEETWLDANEATRGYIKELEHANLSLTMALERTEESYRKLEEKLAEAEAKIDELKQQVIDYETDWLKMRKYYDGAMEKMKMLGEACEVIGFAVGKIENSSTGYNDYALNSLKEFLAKMKEVKNGNG